MEGISQTAAWPMFKNSNVHMDPGKGKGSSFGSIYYIGSDNEVKKDEIYKMRVVDLCRPMTVGYILLLITAINISMTVYLVRPSACTITTHKDMDGTGSSLDSRLPDTSSSDEAPGRYSGSCKECTSHGYMLVVSEDMNQICMSMSNTIEDLTIFHDGPYFTYFNPAQCSPYDDAAPPDQDNYCGNFTTTCEECSAVQGCMFVVYEDETQDCMSENSNPSRSPYYLLYYNKYLNSDTCPVGEDAHYARDNCMNYHTCEDCTSEHSCVFLGSYGSEDNQLCVSAKIYHTYVGPWQRYFNTYECPVDESNSLKEAAPPVQDQDRCWNYSSCEQCASRHGCMFIVYSDDMSMACMSDNATPSSEGPSLSKYLNPEECDEDGGELETYKPFKPASQTSK